MKNVSFLHIALLSAALYSDTIPSTTGSCLRSLGSDQSLSKTSNETGEVFNLQLKSDTLSFWGIINHNCCGSHFLVSTISTDTVFLTRVDTGGLCKCVCPFTFSIKIPSLTYNKYRIILVKEYAFETGLDTLIMPTATHTAAYAEKIHLSSNTVSLRCIPDPSSNSITITVTGHSAAVYSVDIFNINGTLYRSLKNGRNGVWQWETHGVSPGTYLIRYTDGNRSVAEKIILQ